MDGNENREKGMETKTVQQEKKGAPIPFQQIAEESAQYLAEEPWKWKKPRTNYWKHLPETKIIPEALNLEIKSAIKHIQKRKMHKTLPLRHVDNMLLPAHSLSVKKKRLRPRHSQVKHVFSTKSINHTIRNIYIYIWSIYKYI